MDRARHIREIEHRQGDAPGLLLLYETQGIVDQKNGNGLNRRRSDFLDGDDCYMPAFSLWSVGKYITEQLEVDFAEYLAKHYVTSLARTNVSLLETY